MAQAISRLPITAKGRVRTRYFYVEFAVVKLELGQNFL
jgi:hypothetical protein